MAISLSRYVNITSGLGAGGVVPTRDLIGRIFTGNSLLPPQSLISFTTAAEVGSYFGYNSEEFYRAQFYFSFISKTLTAPQSLQYARWVNVAAAPMIIPAQNNGSVLANWTSISNGSFILTMGGFTFTLTGLDFTAAGSLAAVASIIQSAIEAESGGGSVWTAATVTYLPTDSNGIAYAGFELIGGASDVVTNPLIVTIGGGGTDITGPGLLGWTPEGVNGNGGSIWASGSAVESITSCLAASADASNNFGSFLFLSNLALTLSQVIEAATWNLSQNVSYMFLQSVTPANASAWSNTSTGVGNTGGTGLTLTSPTFTQIGVVSSSANTVTGLQNVSGLLVGQALSGTNIPAGTTIATINTSAKSLTMSANATGSASETITFYPVEFPEQFPMMILAATNYGVANSVQNYEYQQVAGLTPSVTTDAGANTYDADAINYYGTTQTAGQSISFYQTGILQGAGVSTNIVSMTPYANEIWLRDAAAAAIMTLLLSMTQIPANAQGQNQILGILQSVINQALNNGTISVGKPLTTNQQMFITSATGDDKAWYQVQNSGYWVNVVIDPLNNEAVYTLIYSKDDVINKVVGTHTLI